MVPMDVINVRKNENFVTNRTIDTYNQGESKNEGNRTEGEKEMRRMKVQSRKSKKNQSVNPCIAQRDVRCVFDVWGKVKNKIIKDVYMQK